MTRLVILAALALGATGCNATTAGAALKIAQGIMSAYSFHASGSARGVLSLNSEYAAVDAETDLVLTYRGPMDDAPGAPVVVRWRKEIQRGSGQRAYRVVFGHGNKFVDVVPVSWAEARASMPWLPEPEGD